MKTAMKRIIAAVAVFGALSALCYSCSSIRVSAVNLDGVPDEYDEELVEWCLDELNTTYQIYKTGPVPAAAIQKLQALFYASAVSLGKAAYAQYEPDFEGNLVNMRTGFYFDTNGGLHVTDLFAARDASKQSKTQLVCISDEHWTTFSGLYDIGTNSVTGYAVRVTGDDVGAVRLLTYINGSPTFGYNVVTNDDGDVDQWFGDSTLEYNLARPAVVCQSFPPGEYGTYMGYLEITDENNNPVYLRNNSLPITEDVLGSDTGTVVNYINNYITENYPLSEVVVPEPTVIETLPNDEYSGLPAGWNEINPVSLPDIQTPSAPLTEAEIQNSYYWLTNFNFWTSVQNGLRFWFAAAVHVAAIDTALTGILLGVSLLSVLGYVLWRWGI